jgi:hypothetical protein
MLRGPLLRSISTLAVLSAVLGASGARATTLLDCRPCAGIRTSDPIAAAAAWTAGWTPGEDARAFLAWTVDLAAPATDANAIAAVRAAGAEPWITLVFRTPAPLREKNEALKAELDGAVTATAGLGGRGVVQIAWEPGDAAAFDPVEYGYLLKRAAVAIGGSAPGTRIATAALSGDANELKALYAQDVAAYVDVVALRSLPADALDLAVAALTEVDPGKPVVVDGEPYPSPADGALARAAEQAAHGAAATLFAGGADANLGPLKAIADEFHGDLSFDSTSSPAGSWAFVRGSDLALRVVAPSGAIQFPDPTLTRVEARDASTGKVVPLGGRRVGQAVEVKVPGTTGAYALLRLERTAPEGLDQVKEAVTVSDSSGPSVEEILRRLQEFEDAQGRRLDHYNATNSTSVQFRVSAGVQTIEATFRGPYFYHRDQPADWVWQEFLINGVRWRGKKIPEIPLLEPEKAAAMPLEVHFTKEYRYSLRGSDTLDGRDCWVVDFVPNVEPREGYTLYRGSVWIDKKVFARVRTKAVQLGLKGDVLSSEETIDYTPIHADGQPAEWTAAAPSAAEVAPFVLPLHMVRQELLSVLNATTLVERDTKLLQVTINGAGFDEARKAALDSDYTMVRDTDQGLRYLEKPKEGGERVVKEGFDKNRLFAIGGVFYEKSLDYPLPLAGVNYFSFDVKHTGAQFDLFFAGVLANASIAQPRLFDTRWDLGASAFGIAIPLEDKQFRNGEESTGETFKILPAAASVKIGHPLGNFVKASFAYDLLYVHYSDSDETAPAFVLPVDHFTHSLSANLKFTRSGYQLSTDAGYSRRSKWEAWGLPGSGDFDKSQTDYWRWRAALSKNWSFSGFKRFSAELDYLGGSDLDRFSKYEFGYFGSSRVHGYRSNRVRAEEAYLAHLNYGIGIGDVFRIDLIGDGAIATDKLAGLDHEFLAGAGIAGTFMGPWQTLINLDLGVPVAGPENGFTIYLVFLKLFN